MSDVKIDARGLSCPQPVVLTQKAIKDGPRSFEVLVSTVVSKENVIRCVEKNNLKGTAREEGDDIIISVNE